MRSLPVIAAILVAACTAPSTAPAPADGASAPGLRATFILANAAGLVALDSSCRALGRIVELQPVEAPSTPALHPDGSRLAFAVTRDSATAGFGTDIVEVKLDGTGLRTLLEHDAENVFYASPRYDPGGTAIYVHRRAAVIRDGAYVGNEDTIERVDLATGQRRTVVRDAADPAISPNGARLVYVKLRDSQPETLWTASLPEGADARPFFRANETFFWVMTPRFSPSGDRVLFSAAGRAPGGEATPPLQPPRVHARELGSRGMATTAVYSEVLRGGLRPPADTPRTVGKLAHLGMPSDLFISPADGSRMEVATQTGDDAIPTWSPDGKRIAYVGVGTFAILTLADGSTEVCAQGEDFFFGDPIWVKER